MAVRDYLLEIQGDNTVFTGRGTSNPPTTWSQTDLVEAIISAPPIQSMDIDPLSGNFGNGGVSFVAVEAASWMLERKTSPITTLTADLSKAATTINVTSTSAFPVSGTVWVNGEAISYTGKTATSFTGCTREQLGTFGKAHDAIQSPANSKTKVYGFNPGWMARRCLLHSFDPADPVNTKVTIATGYIDDITFTDTGFSFGLISVAQRLESQSIATGLTASGRLRATLDNIGNRRALAGNLGAKMQSAELIVELEDYNNPFPYDTTVLSGRYGAVTNGFIKIGSEYVRYRTTAYPGIGFAVNNTGSSAGFGPWIQAGVYPPVLRAGDAIEFTDSATGVLVRTNITRIVLGSNIYHAAHGKAPAIGDRVSAPGLQLLANLERARVGTKAEDHEAGAEISQVWIQSADHVDSVLQFLHSGNESGGTYDVLPSWIGAGIPGVEIDTDSFDALRPYSLSSTTVIEGPVSPKEILADLALVTGGRIFITQAGKITARRDFAPYPDTYAIYTLDVDELAAIPSWNIRVDRIRNMWTWQTSNNVVMHFHIQESKERYGARELPRPKQELLTNASFATAEAIAAATLLRYAEPMPEIAAEVPEEDSNILEPGQVVGVTIGHLPDQQGGEGLTDEFYEVIEFNPNGERSHLRLLRLPQQGNVGLIAPAGIVASVSGSDIVLEPTSTTHLASSVNRLNTPLTDILGSGRDGTEDIDWFLAGDSLQLVDESTLGSATPTTASVVIDSIDYATRTITLTTAVPAWVAAGDYVRLDDYLTCDANLITREQRMTYFTWWSDSTPALPGGDESYEWGM